MQATNNDDNGAQKQTVKSLLQSQSHTINELIEKLIESEWQHFQSKEEADKFMINKTELASSILPFTKLSLQHVFHYTRNVAEAYALKKQNIARMNSPILSSPDSQNSYSSYDSPLTPSRYNPNIEQKTPESNSKLVMYKDQTPGAGSCEVARRAIHKRPMRKVKTIDQIEKLRRSVIILTGDWLPSPTRHATVIDAKVGSLYELADQISRHPADWTNVGQVMVFCDAAWFLPKLNVPHDVRHYALNMLLGTLHDRSPQAKVYMCEPVPLMINVQLIENMNRFIDFARGKANNDPMFSTISLLDTIKPFPNKTRPAEPYYLRKRAAEQVVQEMTRRFDSMASRLNRRYHQPTLIASPNSSMVSVLGQSPWKSVPTHNDVDKLCSDSSFHSTKPDSFI
ncbi:unnamed protein product [Bursaphelenchus okinawaensis]|uniref:Uncharacterized protein n=1 Tax=Bursaphelenchus okinawaensis TaxID=465554 RepID=A0A811L1T9_9BILA|nr:unnamed protein product [Bursaphelenchus okinawaensis]CAG9114962.1 unnamed protein product [Bursaphelenchus okinawaensis]